MTLFSLFSLFKDYYVYYYCVQNLNGLNKTYSCKPYNDPMDILLSERIDHPEHLNQEWLILPIHKYYPQWYHPKRLEKELKARIRVTVADT
jgi:hypothetical protein